MTEETQTPAEAHQVGADDSRVFADFVDGHEAVTHRASIALSRTHLIIKLPDGQTLNWEIPELRALKDQAHANGLVLTDGFHSLARLVVDNPYLAADLRSVAPNLDRRQPVHNWGRIIGWAGGAMASVALIIFVLVPLMADQLATYLPPEGEQALGDATFNQIRTALGRENARVKLCEDADGLEALTAMRTRLNADVDLPYPLKVAVLDHEMVNAFALPGGRVILFRGLIEEAENPDEVAAVLAHEIGHVVNRDPTRDALRAAGSIGVLGLLFGDFAGGTVVLLLANQLINAQYSQAAEAKADDYAHELMLAAEVNPAGLGTFFQRLYDEYGDVDGIMAHFATHPQMLDRVEAAQNAAETGTFDRPVINDSQWRDLRAICGEVAAEEPTVAPGPAPMSGKGGGDRRRDDNSLGQPTGSGGQ